MSFRVTKGWLIHQCVECFCFNSVNCAIHNEEQFKMSGTSQLHPISSIKIAISVSVGHLIAVPSIVFTEHVLSGNPVLGVCEGRCHECMME